MKYKYLKLRNGLRVILVPVKEVGSATSLVLVGAGSRYEERYNNGISHFLEHMAFKGTKKRKTALEISSLIDGIGAESNAFTGKELTGYYIKSSSNHVNLSLDILSDILSNSLFEQAEIDRERGVILEEINLYEDTPMRKIGDIFENLLYQDTPMGWDIAGRKENIKQIKRNDFIAYMNKLYSAENMVLIVSGSIDTEDVGKYAEKYFADLPVFKPEKFAVSKDKQTGSAVLLKNKNTEQAHFAMGVRTVGLKDEKDRYPLSVLSAILGGGMSSRLFHEIRERRGLAYYVRTSPENYIDRGYLATFAGVDPKRIEDAIKVVMDEYEKIKNKNEIKDDELKKAKEYLRGHFILELEDTRAVAAFYGSSEMLERKIETPEEVIEKLNKVTVEEVNRVANKYFAKDRLNLALIGDYKDQARFQKLLE